MIEKVFKKSVETISTHYEFPELAINSMDLRQSGLRREHAINIILNPNNDQHQCSYSIEH